MGVFRNYCFKESYFVIYKECFYVVMIVKMRINLQCFLYVLNYVKFWFSWIDYVVGMFI